MPAPNVEEVQVPCSLFLGLNTEVAPPDLPEGVSPACQDVAFVPGSVFTRPCLHKIFSGSGGASPAFPGNPTVTYQKTFDQPNADPLNLYMTSDGKVWFEDVLNSPNTYTQLAQIISALYAESVTASGAEYLAFSNGLQGKDIPRQIYRTPDGTLQFDRVSQDGPGAPPEIADYEETLDIIQVGALGPSFAIAASTGATMQGNIVTIETTTPHGFIPNQIVYLIGVGGSGAEFGGYNGLQQIQTEPYNVHLRARRGRSCPLRRRLGHPRSRFPFRQGRRNRIHPHRRRHRHHRLGRRPRQRHRQPADGHGRH